MADWDGGLGWRTGMADWDGCLGGIGSLASWQAVCLRFSSCDGRQSLSIPNNPEGARFE